MCVYVCVCVPTYLPTYLPKDSVELPIYDVYNGPRKLTPDAVPVLFSFDLCQCEPIIPSGNGLGMYTPCVSPRPTYLWN